MQVFNEKSFSGAGMRNFVWQKGGLAAFRAAGGARGMVSREAEPRASELESQQRSVGKVDIQV